MTNCGFGDCVWKGFGELVLTCGPDVGGDCVGTPVYLCVGRGLGVCVGAWVGRL